MRVLMVCLGNICRSPVAEGIMKEKAKKYQLDLTVDSAGTSGWHNGELPDPRSMSNAAERGIDISDQRSRKVLLSDFDLFDKIYAMDRSNFQNLLALAPAAKQSKVEMILEHSHPGMKKDVPDPYYTEDGFDEVFDLLDEACENLALKIKKGELS